MARRRKSNPRRRRSNPRRRRNAGLMKKMQKPMAAGISITGVLAGVAIMWFYGDDIKSKVMSMYEKGPAKAGLGALAFNNNPLHMGALAFNALDFSGAEGLSGQQGLQGQHGYGALAFNNPRRMGRR